MLKKLKDLFIVEDASAGSATPPNVKKTKAKDTPPAEDEMVQPVAQEPVATPSAGITKPDPKFVDVLLKAIDGNNLDGFDYLEFKQALQNLGGVEMDEKTRYQSALAMAKTMGATPDKLMSTATHYVNVLKKENAKFAEAVKGQRVRQVDGRHAEIKKLENIILEKQKQIEKLKQEIEQHKGSLEKRKGEIGQAAAKVDATKAGFDAAYRSVMGQIESDIQKMKNYLA